MTAKRNITAKQSRQAFITRLIRAEGVTTQNLLAEALRKRGLAVGQSTLSRDLTELGIRKTGGRYVAPDETGRNGKRLDYSAVVRGMVTCGPHLIVMSTDTGQAQPVAVVIDQADDPSIVATVAGDDTIFVATKNRRTQVVALRRLEQWFGSDR